MTVLLAEIAKIALKATDSMDLDVEFDDSKPDGQFQKDLSIKRLNEVIGDFKFTPLSEGIKKTYEWYLKRIISYA